MADTLRETLEAAMAGGEAPEPAAAPEPVAQAAAEPAPAAQDPSGEQPTGERPRGPDGKFAPKAAAEGEPAPAAAAAPSTETAEPAEPEPTTSATRVPQSLPAAVKAKFATLDPDVQQAFAGLEESVQKAKAEWGKKAERLNRFDEIIAPRRDTLHFKGLDEVQAVQMLFAAQDILDRNPLEGLIHIARSYGVTPQQIAQQMSGQAGQGAPQAQTQNPGFDVAALRPMLAEIVTPLQERLEQLQQQSETEKLTAAQQTVDEFASRPENIYWSDVREDIAHLLRSQRASTLQEAYDMAIWSSPTIRPLLLATQGSQHAADPAVAQRKQAEAAARAKSQAALKAAGSVTGSPAGAAQAPGAKSTGNLREDLKAAWNSHAADV